MAIITGFKSGKSYTFKNLTTEKMLNLYGGRTDKGTNVCQYTADGSDDQKWTFLGDKLYAYSLNEGAPSLRCFAIIFAQISFACSSLIKPEW